MNKAIKMGRTAAVVELLSTFIDYLFQFLQTLE